MDMRSYLSPLVQSPAKQVGENNYRPDPDKCYDWLYSGEAGGDAEKEKKTDQECEDYEDTCLPKALDGGWGWAVVFGAFTISLICDGISYCFGVLYSELLTHYNESKSKTSFVGSVFFGVSMTLGPLSSVLTSRYGSRTMTVVGGLVSSLGMFLSIFAPSINVLFVTFGFVVGAGFSFCFNASIVTVSFYFEKRRSLATGIAVCGTGFGTVTFAPFMDFLIQEFNLAGMFLILSGVCLNLVVCGMLFRPLQFTKKERQDKMLNRFDKIQYNRSDIEMPENTFGFCSLDTEHDDTMSLVCVPTFVPEYLKRHSSVVLMEALQKGRNPDLTLHRYMTNANLQINYFPLTSLCLSSQMGSSVDREFSKKEYSVVKKLEPSFVNSVTDSLLNTQASVLNFIWPRRQSFISHAVNRGSILIAHGDQVRRSLQSSHQLFSRSSTVIISAAPKRSVQSSSRPELTRKPSAHKQHRIIQSQSESHGPDRMNLPDFRRLTVGRSVFLTHLPLYRTDIFFRRLNNGTSCVVGTSCPQLYVTDIYGRKKIHFIKRLTGSLVRGLNSLVDFSLFHSFFFCIFLLSNFFYYFWSDVPYMYATDHAINIGVDRQDAALLVSYIGVANTVGQIVFGVIGDLDVNLLQVYAGASTLAGIFVGVVPLTSHSVMIVCYVLFGFFIAVSYPLTTVILVEYLGLKKLTNAYGILMLVQGVANFLGPALSGYMADTSGDYNLSFYSSGFFYSMSGLVLYLTYIPHCCTKYKRNCSPTYLNNEDVQDSRETF